MKKNLQRFLVASAAMMTCFSSYAIDKVVKSTALTGEITSVEELKTSTFFLQNPDGQLMYTPSGWDIKVGTLESFTSAKNQGGYYKLEECEGHYLIAIYDDENTRRSEPGWLGADKYVNAQPDGQDIIFGLKGTNEQHGQDGANLALWDITYTEGSGFAFSNVGRTNHEYLAWNSTAACPSADIKYWKAYTVLTQTWDETKVNAAADEIISTMKECDEKTAVTNAKAEGNIDALAEAVNKAIDKMERDAVKAQTAPGSNMTGAIINPSFETGTLEGWTSTNGGDIATNMNFGANIVGQKFVERWTPAPGTLSDGTLLQTLTNMPNGSYKLTANMQNLEQGNSDANGTGFLLALNDSVTDCPAPGKVEVIGTVVDSTMTIGVKLQNCSGNWMCVDNFELTYLGALATVDTTVVDTTVTDTTVVEPETPVVPSLVVVKGTYVDFSNPDSVFNDSVLYTGYNKLADGKVAFGNTNWGVNKVAYISIDASKLEGTIKSAKLALNVTGVDRNHPVGVGYNASVVTDTLTYNNADLSITTIGGTQDVATTKGNSITKDIEFDILEAFKNDEDKKVTILVYDLGPAGVTINSFSATVEAGSAIDAAIAELETTIKTAEDKLASYSAGEGIFQYSETELAPLANAIEAAKNAKTDATEESIAAAKSALTDSIAAFAPKANQPVAEQAYLIKNNTIEGKNLSISSDKVSVAADAQVFFTAVEGGYAISNAQGEYIFKTTDNNWTLSATTNLEEAYVITVSAVEGGFSLSGAKGILGLDYGVKAADNTDETVYANKGLNFNGVWTIEAVAAPAEPNAADTLASAAVATIPSLEKIFSEAATITFGDATVEIAEGATISVLKGETVIGLASGEDIKVEGSKVTINFKEVPVVGTEVRAREGEEPVAETYSIAIQADFIKLNGVNPAKDVTIALTEAAPVIAHANDLRLPLTGGSGEGSELAIEVLEQNEEGQPLSAKYTITNGTWGNNASHLSIFKYALTADMIKNYKSIIIEFAETVPVCNGDPTYNFIPCGFVCPEGWVDLDGKDSYELVFTDKQKAEGISDFSVFFNASGDVKNVTMTIKGLWLVKDEASEAVAIESVETENAPVAKKVIIDGKFYIVKDGKMYNAAGAYIDWINKK